MRIGKYEVPEVVVRKCLGRMKSGKFKARDIADTAFDADIDCGENDSRVADRLIQRERKAGNINPVIPIPYWEWTCK